MKPINIYSILTILILLLSISGCVQEEPYETPSYFNINYTLENTSNGLFCTKYIPTMKGEFFDCTPNPYADWSTLSREEMNNFCDYFWMEMHDSRMCMDSMPLENIIFEYTDGKDRTIGRITIIVE